MLPGPYGAGKAHANTTSPGCASCWWRCWSSWWRSRFGRWRNPGLAAGACRCTCPPTRLGSRAAVLVEEASGAVAAPARSAGNPLNSTPRQWYLSRIQPAKAPPPPRPNQRAASSLEAVVGRSTPRSARPRAGTQAKAIAGLDADGVVPSALARGQLKTPVVLSNVAPLGTPGGGEGDGVPFPRRWLSR